ncbi:hypothetical protein O6H91_03G113000 [Diphasiastrum complanatum]|uniref:Uncharacterized protein n=1 Tax=Diphasiastrum complanatum TaxID=34168 RepID=A0ACC2EAW4_DIPCM|nr:hypothetical protein O6H91_03G113000 [Diphasiastrum complanatum]
MPCTLTKLHVPLLALLCSFVVQHCSFMQQILLWLGFHINCIQGQVCCAYLMLLMLFPPCPHWEPGFLVGESKGLASLFFSYAYTALSIHLLATSPFLFTYKPKSLVYAFILTTGPRTHNYKYLVFNKITPSEGISDSCNIAYMKYMQEYPFLHYFLKEAMECSMETKAPSWDFSIAVKPLSWRDNHSARSLHVITRVLES